MREPIIVKSTASLEVRSEAQFRQHLATWKVICQHGLKAYLSKQALAPEAVAPVSARWIGVDVCILQAEQAIAHHLKACSEDGFDRYWAHDNRLTQALWMGNQAVEDRTWLLAQLREARLLALSVAPDCEALLDQLTALYMGGAGEPVPQEVFIRQPGRWPQEAAGPRAEVDLDRFRRLRLFRLQTFFSAIQAAYLALPGSPDSEEVLDRHLDAQARAELFRIVGQGSVLELEEALALLQPAVRVHAPGTPAGGVLAAEPPPVQLGSAALEEYQQYQRQLRSLDKDLGEAARQLRPDASADEFRRFSQRYREISQEREITTYLLDQKKKDLSLTRRALESGKNYVSDNLKDKKAAAKALGQVLAVKAGARLAKATWNALKGQSDKNDWGKIGEELAWDLGEAALTGLATWVLGPAGSKLAGTLMGFIRPVPVVEDPYLARFEQLGRDIDKLGRKMDGLTLHVSQEAQNIISQVQLNGAIDAFREKCTQTHRLILEITDVRAGEARVDEQRLLALDRLIRLQLLMLIRDLGDMHHSSELPMEPGVTPQESPAHLPKELHLRVIELVGEVRGERALGLMDTCQLLAQLAGWVQWLAECYLSRRPVLVQHLCQALLYHGTELSGRKAELLGEIHTLVNNHTHLQAELFSGAFMLDEQIIGRHNLTLYRQTRVCLADPGRFNCLHGFALLTQPWRADVPARQQWHVRPGKDRHGLDGCFEPVPAGPGHYIYRYYIALPDSSTGPDHGYGTRLHSFQEDECPVNLRVRLVLLPGDRLRIDLPEQPDKSVEACIELMDSPVFADALERHLGGPAVPLDASAEPLRLSLPTARYRLDVVCTAGTAGAVQTKGEVQLMLASTSDASLTRALLCWPQAPGQAICFGAPPAWGSCERELLRVQLEPPGASTHQALLNQNNELRLCPHPLRNVMQPGQTLRPGQALCSENGRWRLVFQPWQGSLSTWVLMDEQQLKGSVFPAYAYSQEGNLEVRLQAHDGHLVFYGAADHVIAATGIYGADLSNARLLLSNAGELRLVTPQGRLHRVLALHQRPDTRAARKGPRVLGSRLWLGDALGSNEYLPSSNDRYALKLIQGPKHVQLGIYRQPDGPVKVLAGFYYSGKKIELRVTPEGVAFYELQERQQQRKSDYSVIKWEQWALHTTWQPGAQLLCLWMGDDGALRLQDQTGATQVVAQVTD